MIVKIITVIPIHNELESTKRMLASYYESLYRSPLKNYCDLLIVDDGSKDNSHAWIADNYPSIEVLAADGSLWWSGSVNMGLRHVIKKDYTHFLLFNNDNVLDSRFFECLYDAIGDLGTDKIISSKVINVYPEKHLIYGGIIFNRKKAIFINNSDASTRAIVNTAGGMGVLVPLNTIKIIGLFDSANFPQKSGDTDFYLRAEMSGMRVNYNPNMVVYNDNRISGYFDNSSFRGLIKAYSFPKGYMNLRVDLKFFLKHSNPAICIYRIFTNNLIFLAIGTIKIIKNHLERV